MKIAELQHAATKSGIYDITGELRADQLRAHLKAGRTCEHLTKRLTQCYGTADFKTIKFELEWLRIS